MGTLSMGWGMEQWWGRTGGNGSSDEYKDCLGGAKVIVGI